MLVWYAPDAIYFGIIAHDRSPAPSAPPWPTATTSTTRTTSSSTSTPFTTGGGPSSSGSIRWESQSDGVRSEGAGQVSSLVPGSTDLNPDFTWESKGRITDRGYEVEIRIPFKSLRYPSSGAQSWGFNVTRVVQRTGYTDTWTDVRRANASFLGQEGAIGGLTTSTTG